LPYLRRIHTQFSERAAERIAVHTKLLCRFALITAMTRKNLEYVLLLELSHRVGVSDTSSVHLEDEVVEIAFQSRGLPFSKLGWSCLGSSFSITRLSLRLEAGLDPIRCRVLEVVEAVKQTLSEI
jgi:hypothetical protein